MASQEGGGAKSDSRSLLALNQQYKTSKADCRVKGRDGEAWRKSRKFRTPLLWDGYGSNP